jgi:V/A-type H+-transporting ATPase subunit D
LLRELRRNIYEADKTREELIRILTRAYQNLVRANCAKGSNTIANVAVGSSYEADFLVDFRSIMGVIIPLVKFQREPEVKPDYGFADTNAELDAAFKQFYDALELIADLSRSEGAAFQIANDVRITQRRVNALKHVLIPSYKNIVKQIQLVLEERDREEFVRTKRIKHMIRGR